MNWSIKSISDPTLVHDEAGKPYQILNVEVVRDDGMQLNLAVDWRLACLKGRDWTTPRECCEFMLRRAEQSLNDEAACLGDLARQA